MDNDPRSGAQLKFARSLPHSGYAIEGPTPRPLGDRVVILTVIAVAIAIALGWLS